MSGSLWLKNGTMRDTLPVIPRPRRPGAAPGPHGPTAQCGACAAACDGHGGTSAERHAGGCSTVRCDVCDGHGGTSAERLAPDAPPSAGPPVSYGVCRARRAVGASLCEEESGSGVGPTRRVPGDALPAVPGPPGAESPRGLRTRCAPDSSGRPHRTPCDTTRAPQGPFAPDPLDELADRFDALAGDAVHPDEIAAILESDGMTDDHIRLTYGRDDSFALAEDLYARVERRHAEPEAPPAGPWHSGLAGCLLRGLVFALPGLAYVLGAPLLAGPAAGPLLAGAVTGWVWNQALAHRAYSWLGLGDRRASARALLVGAPAGALVGTAVALAAAGPGAWRVVVFAAGQSLYLGAATALLVLGRERALLCALVPLAGAVPAFRYDLPDPLRAGLLLLSLTATVSFATIVLRPDAWAGRSDSAATPAPRPGRSDPAAAPAPRAAGSASVAAPGPRDGRTDPTPRASAPWARWPGRAMTPAPRFGGSDGVVPPDLRSGGSAGAVASAPRDGRTDPAPRASAPWARWPGRAMTPAPRDGRTDPTPRASAPWVRWPGRAMTPAPRSGRSGRIADPAPRAGRSGRVVDPAPRVRRAGRVERGSGPGRSGPPLVGSLPYGLFGLGTGLLVLYAGGGDVLVTGAAPVVALTLSMGPAEWLLHRFRSESLVGLRTLTSARAFRRAAAGTLAHCLGAYLAVLLALASLGTLLWPGAAALGGVRLLGLLLVGVVLWLGLLLQAFGAVRSAAAVCTLAAAAQTFTPAAGPAVAGAAAAVLAVLACALLVRPTAHRV